MEDIPEIPLVRKSSSNLKCHNVSHNFMLEYICLDTKCSNKRLICSECYKISHASHEVMHYNIFIQLCKDKTVQLKNLQASVEDEIKKSEIKHIENLNSIKDNFNIFINQIIEKQSYPFFQNLKQTTNVLINPDLINTAISMLSETMEKTFDINEINNQLELIAQNLTYSDEQLGLKLQFGPGIFASKIVNEINCMTDNINSFHQKTKESFQEKFDHIYSVTSRNIEEISKKMDEVTEKTDFYTLKLLSEKMIQLENEEITTIELLGALENKIEGYFISLGFKSGRIKIFNLETKTPFKKFYAHEASCIKLLFVKDSMSLFSSGLDQKLIVWNISEGFTFQTSLENTTGPFLDLCVISDDRLLAMAGGKTVTLAQYNLIKLANLDFEEIICKIAYINSMQTVSRIICGDVKGTIHFLDIINHGEKLKQVYRNCNVHNANVENIHVIEKKDLIITTGFCDKRIVIHNANNFQQIKEIVHNSMIFQSFYDKIDEVIFLDSHVDEIVVFNLQNEKVEKSIKSSKLMGNYYWIHARKILACSANEEKKNYLFLRDFE